MGTQLEEAVQNKLRINSKIHLKQLKKHKQKFRIKFRYRSQMIKIKLAKKKNNAPSAM